MLLPRVELPRQSLKQHQRKEQAGISGIIEKTRARRKAAKRWAGRTLSRPGGNPPEGLSRLIIGLASRTPSCLQLLCLNIRFSWVFEAGFLGIPLRMNSIFLETTKVTHLNSPEGDSGDLVSVYVWSFETYGTLMRRCTPIKRVNLVLYPWNGEVEE